MEGIISEEFATIIKKIPDQSFDMDVVFNTFKEYVPTMAKKYGIVFMTAQINEFNRKLQKVEKVKEVTLFDIRMGEETNDDIVRFETGNGGFIKVITGISKEMQWTDVMKEDNYIFAKTIYLLAGRARAMSDLIVMTFTDPLTGVASEAGLGRFTSQKIQEGTFKEYCSDFLNIKNMKLWNRRYSERIGNMLLRSFGKKMEGFVGEKGCVARLGGDNFIVLVEKNKQEEFIEFVQNMEAETEVPGGKEIRAKLEARIGCYYIKNGDGHHDALRSSDIALRYAKSGGYPDVVYFEEKMGQQTFRVKQLEESIPKALKDKELIVYYQPKMDIAGENPYMFGGEALVRWIKDGTMISPGEFIPILEDNGMVTDVDFYVLEAVCKDIIAWKEKGIEPVRISVNFSRRHLVDLKFIDRIEKTIKDYKIDPKYLEIEITESYVAEDVQVLRTFKERMQVLGVELALDDFGSGFSSLKMVKSIVTDVIKLDKSIIDGVGDPENNDRIIVSHVIDMIKCLGKDVIAEGVEEQEQADFLKENGCTKIQGYLYSRPLPKEEFEEKLCHKK